MESKDELMYNMNRLANHWHISTISVKLTLTVAEGIGFSESYIRKSQRS
jgi:hypothetical protein